MNFESIVIREDGLLIYFLNGKPLTIIEPQNKNINFNSYLWAIINVYGKCLQCEIIQNIDLSNVLSLDSVIHIDKREINLTENLVNFDSFVSNAYFS